MSTDKNHSEQFERYLKGQMSPEEAHAFERDVLDDPFALEALEGLSANDPRTVVEDIKSLKNSVLRKKKGSPVWLRAAAMIAMLIVGSIAVFYLFSNVEQSQLASKEALPMDSGSLEADIEQETIAEVTNEVKTDFDSDGLKVENEDREVVESFLTENETVLSEEEFEINTDTELALSHSENAKQNDRLEGKSEVIQLADVEAMEEVVIEPTSDEMIVMEEVAVPAQAFSGKKKVAKEAEAAIARSAARSGGAFETNNQMDVSPKPIIGDSLYQQYLKEELIYPDAARENGIEGEVLLSLTISEFGEILDIKIEKSLGYGCDEEAVRLINEGPEWTFAYSGDEPVKAKVEVKVKFKL
ncbi:energy transducer TonB [Ekhidna sp.]|uniref:energy transducer TonB n=1 Tax=Ekhidna sp. TaxID=2608089 RepID=UPI003CCB7F33